MSWPELHSNSPYRPTRHFDRAHLPKIHRGLKAPISWRFYWQGYRSSISRDPSSYVLWLGLALLDTHTYLHHHCLQVRPLTGREEEGGYIGLTSTMTERERTNDVFSTGCNDYEETFAGYFLTLITTGDQDSEMCVFHGLSTQLITFELRLYPPSSPPILLSPWGQFS